MNGQDLMNGGQRREADSWGGVFWKVLEDTYHPKAWLDIYGTTNLSVNGKWSLIAAKWYQRKFCSLSLLSGSISQCLGWMHSSEYRHIQSLFFITPDDHIVLQYLCKSYEGLQEMQCIHCSATFTMFYVHIRLVVKGGKG